MVASVHPLDSRVARKPVGEQLDKVAGGLDAALTLLTAQLGEVIKTQQDGNAMLAVMARTVSDDDRVGVGLAGVTPQRVPSKISAQKALLAASPATRMGTREMNQPYTAGIEYNVGIAKGSGTLAAQTRTGVKSGVANWLSGRASYLADQYELRPGEHIGHATGNLYRENPNVQMDDHGRYRNLTTGRFASSEDAIEEIMTGAQRSKLASHVSTANVMSRMGEAWSSDQGIARSLAAGLPEGALKVAGGAAVAVTAANKAWQWAQGQHEQNRAFQEVYGGSNSDQYGERAAQWFNKNVTGRFSMLGGENYDALFKGGMNMGLRGSDRSRYISTGADIMGSGASAEQTKQVLDMSIEAGLGLSGLAKAIKEVNDSAREAGVNAKHARDMFIANYEAGTEIMFGSQNAKNFATLTTQGQLAQARPFQNINGTGLLQNNAITQMRASQLGMSLGELEVAQTQSAGGTIASGEQALKQFIDSAPNPEGKGKSVRQVVDQFISEHQGYNAKYDQTALGEALKENGWNEVFCHMLLQRFSIDDGGQQYAPGYIGNLYTQDSAGSRAVASTKQAQVDFAPKTIGNIGGHMVGASGQTSGRVGAALGIRTEESGLALAYAQSINGGALKADNLDVLKGKQFDPRITTLINKLPEIGGSASSKVRVQTKDGPRIISLKDALRDFPDQVANGARFVEGVNDEFMDKTTGEITGAPTGTITSDKKAISGYVGQTDADFAKEQEKKNKDDSKKSDQKVTLDLTPEAKRLLMPVMNDPYYSTSAPTSGTG